MRSRITAGRGAVEDVADFGVEVVEEGIVVVEAVGHGKKLI